MLSFGQLFEDEGVTEETTWRAIDQLWNLPTFEEKLTEHQTMIEEMKIQIDASLPGIEWKDVSEDRGDGTCSGDYRFTNGTSRTVHWLGSPGLDEEAWSQVSNIVVPIAAKYGFTELATIGRETSSSRMFGGSGAQGSDFVLNTSDTTFALVSGTGCYLEEEARENLRTVGIPYGADYNPWPWAIPDEPRYQ